MIQRSCAAISRPSNQPFHLPSPVDGDRSRQPSRQGLLAATPAGDICVHVRPYAGRQCASLTARMDENAQSVCCDTPSWESARLKWVAAGPSWDFCHFRRMSLFISRNAGRESADLPWIGARYVPRTWKVISTLNTVMQKSWRCLLGG